MPEDRCESDAGIVGGKSSDPFTSSAPLSRPRMPGWFSGTALLGAVLLALLILVSAAGSGARAGTLRVRVVDARNGAPLSRAFVQVGSAPGDPFASNWGWTRGDGSIQFTSFSLGGPQIVTAGKESFALFSVMDFSGDTLTLALHPEVRESALPEPKAEVAGTVTGISVLSNDGNLDVGIAYPAVRLSDLLAQRTPPFEVPPDTIDFPVVGRTVLPGNVVVPTQIELSSLTFSKTHFHFFVPDHLRYDLMVVAGRVPLRALSASGFPLLALDMRETGAERNVAVDGGRTLNIHADLDLSHTLSVQVPESPRGATVSAAALADFPGFPVRSVLLDLKSGLADTLAALRLSGLNPAGDLLGLSPYLAAWVGDSSAVNAWQTGRIDRLPLSLPANRTVSGFFLVPDLAQIGDQYTWSNVARPRLTSNPTWGMAIFRLDAAIPGEPSVTPKTAWEVWAPAGEGCFRLPLLAPGAPGGLPDPGETLEDDRLLWEETLCDAPGGIQDVLADPYARLTRWSRRAVEIQVPSVNVEEVGLGTLRDRVLRFKLVPNPGNATRDVLWDRPPRPGQPAQWSIWDPAGRRLTSGTFTTSGGARDERAITGIDRLATGIYWVRIRVGDRAGSLPLMMTR